MQENSDINFSEELNRKTIHLASIAIPLGMLFFEKELVLKVCILLMLVIVIPDILRKFSKRLNALILYFFKKMLRENERNNKAILNGASWVMIDAVLIILVFPSFIASVSLSILIICDLMAAIIGRKYGKHKIYDKSLEGTAAFILSGMVVIVGFYFSFSPGLVFLPAGLIAVIATAIVELHSKRYNVDDNLAIPFIAGTVLWIASSLFAAGTRGFAYII